MTKYQWAVRMSAQLWFDNLETCCWDYIIHEMFLYMLKRWKHLRELTWWWDCNTWYYGVGYKSLTGTIKKGSVIQCDL